MDQTCDQKQNLPTGSGNSFFFNSLLNHALAHTSNQTPSQINLNQSEDSDSMETVENNGNNRHVCEIYWMFLFPIYENYKSNISCCSLTYQDLLRKPTQSSKALPHTNNILPRLHTIFHILLSPLLQEDITFQFGQIGEEKETDSED